MQSFGRGWSFLKQAWQMALKDKDLLKPTLYSLIIGFIVSLVFIPLIVAASFLTGGEATTIGSVLMFIIGAVMVFIQYTVGYIFSAMTVHLIYAYLTTGDGRMDQAWAIVKRDFFDLLSLAAASTVVNLIKNAVKGKGKQSGRNFLAGLIDAVWTEAAFLILPAMVIEDIPLKDGLKRAAAIIKNNLLLVGLSTVGVKAVNGLLSFLLSLLGLGLGAGVGFGIITLTGPESIPGLVAGIGLGVLIAAIFIMIATVITSYTATAYHTCLYLWARQVENAGSTGQTAPVQAPAPLAAVLGQ